MAGYFQSVVAKADNKGAIKLLRYKITPVAIDNHSQKHTRYLLLPDSLPELGDRCLVL